MTRMAFDAGSRDEDAILLARYATGDRVAARELVQRLSPSALAVAQRMLGNRGDAEDVVQEALLRLWKIAPDWESGRARVSTWLYRVVLNLCTDRLRKHRPAQMPEGWDAEDDAPAAFEALQTKARTAALDQALQTLPDRQRQAVILREIQGLANPEIAGIMEISVEAVESLVARGRRGLKAALSGKREELGYADD
ncbi:MULTISPECIES: RNA polymerase sigma factor [unclassified Meridianimarinicoccus]|uniref:RNA polymerase sigma factor n=1 Tax=unclassified Meridianimarinicoccus TaxID=2923344 RepID=UPI0037448268